VLDRAALPVLVDDPEAVLQRSLRIRLMEVVEVDAVGPEATKALVDLGAQDLGSAPFVATTQSSGDQERAAPIVCSLSPPV
jgi:hypothetical protein